MLVADALPVETPGGVRLALPLATVGERLAAFVVDLGVLATIAFVTRALVPDEWIAVEAFALLFAFVLRHGYFFLFELRWQGTTPGKRLLGLALAMGGVAIAVADRGGGTASLAGDALALVAALCWAGIALCVRLTPLQEVAPEQQLLWQLIISAPVLLIASAVLGAYVREIEAIHLWGLTFQIFAVASFGFLIWFWLMKMYPASTVASFSFLSPVFSVILGWLLLKEEVGLSIWLALIFVAAGLFLINRRS